MIKSGRRFPEMKPPTAGSSNKRRGGFLWRAFATGIGIVFAFLLPRSALAAKNQPPQSFPQRALKVKKAFDEAKLFGDTSDPGPREMQWGNWPNWQNWGNWGNWNNWNNWANWRNW